MCPDVGVQDSLRNFKTSKGKWKELQSAGRENGEDWEPEFNFLDEDSLGDTLCKR
jgi:hypothetical protein